MGPSSHSDFACLAYILNASSLLSCVAVFAALCLPRRTSVAQSLARALSPSLTGSLSLSLSLSLFKSLSAWLYFCSASLPLDSASSCSILLVCSLALVPASLLLLSASPCSQCVLLCRGQLPSFFAVFQKPRNGYLQRLLQRPFKLWEAGQAVSCTAIPAVGMDPVRRDGMFLMVNTFALAV